MLTTTDNKYRTVKFRTNFACDDIGDLTSPPSKGLNSALKNSIT